MPCKRRKNWNDVPDLDINLLDDVNMAGAVAVPDNPEQALAQGDPEARNREGDAVFRGQGRCATRFYCGIKKGTQKIPGSDGRCGPTNGPQCEACRVYQEQHPLENEFGHLMRNPADLVRMAFEAEKRRAEGVANARQNEIVPDSSSDSEEGQEVAPQYPEDQIQSAVETLVKKKFPAEPMEVINEVFRDGGILDQVDMDTKVKLLVTSGFNGNPWYEKKIKPDTRLTAVVKMMGRRVAGFKCRGITFHNRCGDNLEQNSTNFLKLTCSCHDQLSVGLFTIHKDLQCKDVNSPTLSRS